MKLYYENSKGEIIDFMNWPVVAQNPEVLAERSWGYATETNQDGTKRFKQFYKELEQKKLEAENSEIVDIVRGMSISLTELPLLFEKLKDGGTLGQSVPKSEEKKKEEN